MPKYRRKPAEKQKQEILPACERTDKLETRENYYLPGQSRKMFHRKTRHPEEVDRVMFRIVYIHNNRVLEIPPLISNDNFIKLQEEVETAVKSLKKGTLTGVDNIP